MCLGKPLILQIGYIIRYSVQLFEDGLPKIDLFLFLGLVFGDALLDGVEQYQRKQGKGRTSCAFSALATLARIASAPVSLARIRYTPTLPAPRFKALASTISLVTFIATLSYWFSGPVVVLIRPNSRMRSR